MALVAGDAREGTGLAGAIASKLKEMEPAYNPHKDKGHVLPDSLAQSIVEYLVANAEVDVNVQGAAGSGTIA